MAGLSKKYLALIALPLLLAACQTADQQKKRQQQQEAIGAINEFSAQKPAPIDVVISEFETRCKAVVGKEFESIEQAATAAGLETPGVFIPSVGRFRARTMFFGPNQPSIAFLMPQKKTNGCSVLATTDEPLAAHDALIAAYEARDNSKSIELPRFGRFGAGTVFDLLDDELTVVVTARKEGDSTLSMQMFQGNLNLDKALTE